MAPPLNPAFLELPLLGAILGFSAAAMGLSGADLHDFLSLRVKMDESPLAGFVYLEDNGILTVDIVMLAAGAATFLTAIIGLFLCGRQLGKRRGEYSGKGTSAWLLLGLVLLLLSGLWAGTAAAYTAFAAQHTWTFSAGPNFTTTWTIDQQAFFYAISHSIVFGVSNDFQGLGNPRAAGVTPDYLGAYNVQTLDEINAIPRRYIHYASKWRAAVIVAWFCLGSTFLLMVVHFALPFVWKALGLVRQPRQNKQYYQKGSYNNQSHNNQSYGKPSSYNKQSRGKNEKYYEEA